MFHYVYQPLIQYKPIAFKFANVLYLKSFSSAINEQSLTVSYLTNVCGLSFENALLASKRVKIKDTETADSVIKLLTSHGFTKTHISSLVLKHPPVLVTDAEKILKPKIEFYESIGIVGSDLPNLICSYKKLLMSSLEHLIVPNLEFLKDYIGRDEELIHALKQQCACIFKDNIQKVMLPNINTLLAHGVPKKNIGKLFTMYPKTLMARNDLFEKWVISLEEIDLDPKTLTFIWAIRCMSIGSTVRWEKGKQLYLNFGWSEKDFVHAFRVQPMIMGCSLKKIATLMEFFVQEMGLNPLRVAACPNVFLLSLERRIIPRWSVLQVLITKGLIRKNINVLTSLNFSKLQFEKKFIIPHKDVPEVIKRYQGG